jgi:pyroglutamyl-peptidase
VRYSENAGRYLCEFIYYNSLAYLNKNDQTKDDKDDKDDDKEDDKKKYKEPKVVFLHVPADSNPEAIEMGTKVLIELVRAMVQSRRAKDNEGRALGWMEWISYWNRDSA